MEYNNSIYRKVTQGKLKMQPLMISIFHLVG